MSFHQKIVPHLTCAKDDGLVTLKKKKKFKKNNGV